MTPEQLLTLMAGGESLTVEFKGEERSPLSDRELVEAAICLANRSGNEPGWLLIGVEDDGRVTGARPRHEGGRTDPLRVQALIANRTQPSLTTRVELLVVAGGRQVLVIEVPTLRTPVGTADGTYLRRAIGARGRPQCLPFHFHEMQTYQVERGLLDYSALIIPEARWEDLDPLEFARFRRSIRESEGLGDSTLLNLPDLELAKALGAMEGNHEVKAIRVLALLLFGQESALRRYLPTHEVAFQVLADIRVEVNDFFRWPLLRVMDEILTRFRARNREEELIVGMVRVGIPDFSRRAFREGVANALIHRDYTRLNGIKLRRYAHTLPLDLQSSGRRRIANPSRAVQLCANLMPLIRDWARCISSGIAIELRFTVRVDFLKAYAWTICWSLAPSHATRSWPMPSNAPGLWSAPLGALTRSFTINCTMAVLHPPMTAVRTTP